ncbi:DNA repair helicase RAD25 [Tothia fuscella]|uniref:DNA 3'-5' helicase n=1 Tax=Tothia fuscella TaxID=1048955 RepID=A0A9P4U4J0_9PEZI|nr:DNA repair helicase RAD25 [Tothia fuscella]
MPPKRKASDGASLPSKRIASGLATPASASNLSSDDDYDEDENMSEDDADMRLVQKFGAPKRDTAKKLGMNDPVSTLFRKRVENVGHVSTDFGNLDLKPDHAERPLWISPIDRSVIMESFAPTFKEAERFLINIAEPQSRVSRIHEYTITTNSLYAAVSVGLTVNDIISRLEFFSKTPLPADLKDFIIDSTKSYGRARLVLKQNKFWVESSDPVVLQTLLRDPEIRQYRVSDTDDFTVESAPTMGSLYIPGTKMAAGAKQVAPQQGAQQDENEGDMARGAEDMTATLLNEDDEDDQPDQVHAFEVLPESIQQVRERCKAIEYPLTEEYDFRNDFVNANLEIDLKPAAQIRPYQEQALSKMFGNGRARSGIIVLPCGAGKTLVGITAACTVKKGVIVLCTSAMSVNQWRDEFLRWSNVNPNDIAVFTAEHKDQFSGNTGIIISTYNMMAMNRMDKNGKPTYAHDTKKVLDFIQSREWGLMILDEVHVAPADTFKRVTYKVKAHAKLGLTATLLREDDKIDHLNFLIGPKLYEANWQELSEQGHIARVQCAEVWCPMTPEFYDKYLDQKEVNMKNLLSTMNPRKFQAAQFLIEYHEKRGDKVIVFSDNVYALERFAQKLGKVFIYGGTPQAERQQILENFRYNPSINTMFLSKIGDTSLDLPEATCLIQISSHYGSRRQEAQRLGRILRAKRRNDEGFNAFFYSLVSKDTQEMFYSSKRQAFLVDQGYAFKVITHLQGIDQLPNLAFTTLKDRVELLTKVLIDKQSDEVNEGDIDWGTVRDHPGRGGAKKKKGARYDRSGATLSEFSGGANMAYQEQNKNRNKELKKGAGNAFIRKVKRQQQKKREANRDL